MWPRAYIHVHHHIENVIVIEITGGWYTENISNE